MGAAWAVARAATRRRRAQTALIGVIVTLCTATVLVGVALLAAVTGPFDRTFAQLNGAHATVLYDGAKIADDRVAATTRAGGVAASAGPFSVATAALRRSDGNTAGGSLRIVGRTEPGAPVDQLKLTYGRWAAAPGEIVLGADRQWALRPERMIGQTYTLPGVGTVTVVGLAYSVTRLPTPGCGPTMFAASVRTAPRCSIGSRPSRRRPLSS